MCSSDLAAKINRTRESFLRVAATGLFGRIVRKIFQQRRLTRGGFKQTQRRQQHAALKRRIVGHAKRPAQDKRHPQRTRRAYRFGVLAHQ